MRTFTIQHTNGLAYRRECEDYGSMLRNVVAEFGADNILDIKESPATPERYLEYVRETADMQNLLGFTTEVLKLMFCYRGEATDDIKHVRPEVFTYATAKLAGQHNLMPSQVFDEICE